MPGWGLCILSADSGQSVQIWRLTWGELSRRLVWCWCVVWGGERNGAIHSKWDMVKSLIIVAIMETKRDKKQIKERAVVPVSSLFFLSS